LRNTATGVTTTVMTNERGLYRVPNLIPGTYEVTASAGGFATTVATDLILAVGAELAVNPQLRVGTATQVIQVSGEMPDVATTNSTVSAVVDERTVRELPLNARDWTLLATL